VFGSVLGVVFGLFFGLSQWVGRDVPDRLTADRLMAVRPDMSYADLERILGAPLCYTPDGRLQVGDHAYAPLPTVCAPSGTVAPPASTRARGVSLVYARPVRRPRYPRIQVHVRAVRLTSVDVDDFFLFDDEGVYNCDAYAPDGQFFGGSSRDTLLRLIGR
jgi:hypothetical protein